MTAGVGLDQRPDRPSPLIRYSADRHSLAALVASLTAADIVPDDAVRLPEATHRPACPNRTCPLHRREAAENIRKCGAYGGHAGYYCALCGVIFTENRILLAFDSDCSADGYPHARAVDRARERLAGWRRDLTAVCIHMRDADEPITTAVAFERAGIPRTANLRAARLGLVAIIDDYAAVQAERREHGKDAMRMHRRREQATGDGRAPWLPAARDRRQVLVVGRAPMMTPTDMTDGEWISVAPRVAPPNNQNAWSRQHDRRVIVDAILYRLHTRCAWMNLPARYPPSRTVSHYHRAWERSGVWDAIRATLVDRGYLARLGLREWRGECGS